MSTVTGNQQLVKQINKTLVLEKVMNEAPISRAYIAKELGLNKGTVSSLVSELIDEHLVFETGPGESSGGRRPVMLTFNKDAGYAIGVDLGVNYILSILTDLKGNVVREIYQHITNTEYEHVFSIIKKSINDLIESAPDSPYGIIGIGIGVPGIVNNQGEILIAPNLHWENVQLKEQIEKTFNLPVVIENEANAGAYGEKLFGAGKDFNNMIYVSAGIGIGVGIIIDGELYTGNNGYSGEMGHTIIMVDGKKCSCGSVGCWELYASEKALLEHVKEKHIINSECLTIEMLIEEAEAGNDAIIEVFKEIGKYLSVGINNIIKTFNPQQVIIGNRLAMLQKWIEVPIQEFIQKHCKQFLQEDLSVEFSALKKHSVPVGVSALSIEHFLKSKILF
ncbi:MAG: ROK family transcriptional regulator [Caldibacillus sp.]